MPLNYDECGHIILRGAFAVDQVAYGVTLRRFSYGTDFSIHVGEDYTYLEHVKFYRDKARVDHYRPRLSIRFLTRAFFHGSLLFENKLDVRCAGFHLGELQLETDTRSSTLSFVKQATSPFRARASYCDDGIELFLNGELLPPPYVPEKPLPDDGRPLPKSWPTHFQVDTLIPWEAVPFLLGNANYYHRVRQLVLAKQFPKT